MLQWRNSPNQAKVSERLSLSEMKENLKVLSKRTKEEEEEMMTKQKMMKMMKRKKGSSRRRDRQRLHVLNPSSDMQQVSKCL